jgi:hypothetical protein
MTAPTISTEGLRELLERGSPVTVLDVRPAALLDARSYRVDNLFRRLARAGDRWRSITRRGQSLNKAQAALLKLV